MLRSFYSGVSGLKVNQVKLDVIGNNIANVGTTAFKSSRVRFKDMVSQNVNEAGAPGTSLGGVNAKQVGLGVQVSGIDTMVGQGMMQPTSRNLDVAMDGQGYLMVARGPLNGEVTLKDDTIDTTAASTLDVSYTRDGALIRDDAGHLLTSDGARVMGYSIAGNTSYDVTTGLPTITFVDANGTIVPAADTDKLIPLSIPDSIELADGSLQRITTFSIEKNGEIKANLQNGSVAVIGQIAMASFSNPEGLKKIGNNLFENTANSGVPVVRSGTGATTDNSSGYGDMLQGMLEMSNVDLAEQFTDMIIAQRAFQASGKSITTGDEILQELIGLKR
ncbi:flagellar hook-basal body complex protein [Clostridium algoriphilum]|uniref:flagellar hook-basal body complex protein n=1 Tax=Clostridium algoriphilum TaxID=198347 RepID=UPI001CF3D13D|nr:flagellar hook-basal body complex protein [Clostridium algoriphilum]MCB2291923.1 flagellar hook-basal body complex protein [Clostridium algoriphilum]